MNASWGYNPADNDYKTVYELIVAAAETVGRGGNLLLNISPRGDGSLPPEQRERLDALGRWMAVNGEALHGVESGLEPWQFYGPSTRRRTSPEGDETLYCFLVMAPVGPVVVRGLNVRRVVSARVLGGNSVQFTSRCAVLDQLFADPEGELILDVERALSESDGEGADRELDGLAPVRVIEIRLAGSPVAAQA